MDLRGERWCESTAHRLLCGNCSLEACTAACAQSDFSLKLRYVTHIGPGTRVHNWPANPWPVLSPDNFSVQLDTDLQAWPSHLVSPHGLCPLYAHGGCTGPCIVTNLHCTYIPLSTPQTDEGLSGMIMKVLADTSTAREENGNKNSLSLAICSQYFNRNLYLACSCNSSKLF